MQDFNEDDFIKDLKIDAHAVGIPSGAASAFITQALKDAKKSLKSKTTVTEKDFKRAILKELKKYHADLAYVFEFRDKII